MLKKNILYILGFVIILIVVLIFGFRTKNSFINDIDANSYIYESSSILTISEYKEDITNIFNNSESIIDIKELYDSSPIIVRVKLNIDKPRIKYYYSTLTSVEVIDIYKGEIESENIEIFEPIDGLFFNDSKSTIIDSLDGYNWIGNNYEYIMFLKPLNSANYSKNKYVYMPTTTVLSKYEISNNRPVVINEGSIGYSDVKDNEVLLRDNLLLEKFIVFKEQILNDFGVIIN